MGSLKTPTGISSKRASEDAMPTYSVTRTGRDFCKGQLVYHAKRKAVYLLESLQSNNVAFLANYTTGERFTEHLENVAPCFVERKDLLNCVHIKGV